MVSGLKLNMAKTQGLKINAEPVLLAQGREIKWSNKIQILGLTFYDSGEAGDQYINDLDKYILKMKERCAMWNKRRVSLKGKVIVLNVLVYPIIYYAASNLYFPDSLFRTIQEMSRNFLWNGHRPKISLDTLTLPVDQGGLGLHDFALRIKASRLAWVKRAILAPPGPWTDFLCESSHCTEVLDVFLRKNRNCPGHISPFYISLFREWQQIFDLMPLTDMACRSEPLWNNRNIQLRSLARLESDWRELGIRRVNDVLVQGKILSVRDFRTRFGRFTTQAVLDKLSRYIGRDILDTVLPMSKRINEVGLYIAGVDGRQLDLGKMSTKELYQVLLGGKKHRVTARASWAREYEDYVGIESDLQWKFWYSLPCSLSREVRLQSFQYRVLHRTIPCNAFLQQIRVKDSKTYNYCDEWDDLIHFFYYCPDTVDFWDSIALWLSSSSDIISFPEDLEETDFLFGIKGFGDDIKRINFILLYGRFYIYKQKIFGNGELDTYKFLVELKNLLLVERLACIQEGALQRKFAIWKQFYEEL